MSRPPGAADRPRPPSGGPWAPDRRGLTVGLLLAVTTNALAALAVVTIAPRIPADLGGLELYGWVFSAYLLASLLGTVWGGGTADRRGLRLPFGVGLGAFAIGLALAALAPTMAWVVAARVLQGFGGGTVTTCVYVAVTRAYPDAQRPRLMAYLSSAWVVPALVGPALAGLVAEAFGWRAVFAFLAPVLGLVAVLTWPRLGAVAGRPAGDVAGVLSANRRVMGLMPHPERAVDPAQGGTDGHRSSAGLRPLAEISRVHSNVIWPTIAVLIQISAGAAMTSYMDSRPKSVGEVKL